ncbi:T9SS type A sorting domain-containing protein [Tamlana sp. I1]|uniref:T9SS type A sorting domain-containing protein n=1 Tax=Tamlana sp. I1 TaxID=2762061 RepID=UPI00188FF157|nr:T9SS type A sorting domain-containing protein [Tamlana sp. I1]
MSVFFLIATNLYAQNVEEFGCGSLTSPKEQAYYNNIKPQLKVFEQAFLNRKFSKSGDFKVVNSVPIKIHIIRNSDGSGGLQITELHDIVENLNRIYADAFLEFFICEDINYINNDSLSHFKKGDESVVLETDFVPGLINIYFTDDIKNTSNQDICGYSNNDHRNDIIVLNNHCATNDSSLAHELGHFFSLLHTHGDDNLEKTTELVDGSNCDTDGDGICDTPADPGLSHENVDNFCHYTGTAVDANGDRYHPDPKNIMSYSKKACRTTFTEQQLARIYAFYNTTKSYLSCSNLDANFIADEQSKCNSFLTVNFKSTNKNATSWAWDINTDGIIDYTTKNIKHTFEDGIYDVTLTVSNATRTVTKSFKNYIKVGTDWEVLLHEDFEGFEITGNHGWSSFEASANDYHWYTNRGDTQTEGTGPSHSTNDNQEPNSFIYAEASGANPGDIAEFISPCIYVDYENTALEFAYHMFGKNIGELHVDIKTENGYINDVIPALYGQQQKKQTDAFLTKTVDLSSYTNQTINLRFRAIRGESWDGDIAIDNIFIKTIHTAISDAPMYSIYPNPVKNDLLYVKNNASENYCIFQISNLRGQTLISGTLTNAPINLSRLESGTYILSIVNDKYEAVVKKIVK